MQTFKKVARYRKFIQDFIVEHPKKNSGEILKHLLLRYSEPSDQSLQALSTFRTTKLPQLKQLVKTLNKKLDIKTLDILNQQLETNPIKKDDDLFAMLIAYFYYFEDIHSNAELQNFTALYNQIFVPLHLYRERLEKDNLDNLLTLINDPVKNRLYGNPLIIDLKITGIPKNEYKNVIEILIKQLNNPHNQSHVVDILNTISIPDDQIKIVFPILFKLLKETYLLKPILQVLTKMPLSKEQATEVTEKVLPSLLAKNPPDKFNFIIVKLAGLNGQLDTVITKLVQNTKIPKDPTARRVFACMMIGELYQLKLRNEQLENIIDTLMIQLNDASDGYFKYQTIKAASEALAKLPIPSSRQNNTVEIFMDSIDKDDNFDLFSTAMRTLTVLPIPKNMQPVLIKKIIDEINDQNHLGIFCKVLKNIPIPNNLHKEVFNTLFANIDSYKNYELSDIFSTLILIANSEEEHLKVTNKIIEKLNGENDHLQNLIIEMLAESGAHIPIQQSNKIISALIANLPNFKNTEILYNLCKALSELSIPNNQLESVVNILFELTKHDLREVNVRAQACHALAKIDIPKHMQNKAIAIVYDILDKGNASNLSDEVRISAYKILVKMDLNEEKVLEIIFKLLEKGYSDEALTNTLVSLFEKLPIENKTKFIIQLENLKALSPISPTRLTYLSFIIKTYQGLNAFNSGIRSHVPLDIVNEMQSKL